MKLKNEIMRGLKWTAGAKFGSQLITWGITIFVMRLLAPSDYGLLAMASVLLALLSMFSEVGLGPALVQQADVSDQKFRQAFGIVLLVNLALFVLLNLLAPLVARFYAEDRLVTIVRVLSIQFLLIPLSVIPDVLLQRQLEFKKRSLIDLGSAVLSSVSTLGLALYGFGVWSLVVGNLAGLVLRLVSLNLAAPFRSLPSFSLTGMRQLLAFGGNVTASRFLWFFFTQADTIIVGRVLGGNVLGMYSVAMHLATLPVQRVSAILNQVAFPAFSRFQHEKDVISAQLLKAFGLISFVAFPVLWGMSSVAPDLVLVLLGPNWTDAILPLQILTLVMPFRTLVGFLPSITDAVGRPEIGLQNVILGCLTIPLAFYVGSRWGIAGVAFAWVTVYPFVLLINMQRMLAVLGVTLAQAVRKLAPPIGCSAAMYASVWVVHSQLHNYPNRSVVLIAEVLTGAASYALLTFAGNRSIVGEIKMLASRKNA
jgi:teichuronic acid exporter